MQLAIDFTAASREFYAPLDNLRGTGPALEPSRVPEPWIGTPSGVWTYWHRPDRDELPEDGWKVHVSARPDRLRTVLDRVAAVCFAHEVPFKHLATEKLHWWTHQKHAQRGQGGKFIAAYPADVAAADALMDALRTELAGEEGPYILTDRRYKDAKTVFYRYGAYIRRFRPQADGTFTLFMRDPQGQLMPDVRGVSFHLPPGVADPFLTPSAKAAAAPKGDLGGFMIDSSVRFTNAGGTYRGHQVATNRRVFIKEARPHNGLRDDNATATEQLREEWDTLTALRALAPGLAPEPISYFRAWEHEFLVCEHVDGLLLGQWTSRYHPLLRAGTSVEDFADYYERAAKIVTSLEETLDRLHALGYVFVDVSPSNVVLGDDGTVRLIDLGSAHRLGHGPFLRAGTPGYVPPEHLVGDDLLVYDEYGISALTLHMLAPLHSSAERNPHVLPHLHRELTDLAPVPDPLWERATRFHAVEDAAPWPTPDEVAADPVGRLTDLRDGVADALLAMTDLDNSDSIYPTIPQGYLSNTLCVAYGTAGVIHALRRAGRALPDGLLERFRRDAVEQKDGMGPGLYAGTAGLAWVLADNGLLDEATDLLKGADGHRLTGEAATLFGGSAGVALAHLSLYGHTRDDHHLDRALALAAALPTGADLIAQLGADDAVGLAHGRAGVALMLQQLAGVTGDERFLREAIGLLHAELDRASEPDAPGTLFPVSSRDNRAMPYLYAGTAGILFAATRCLRHTDDERLSSALPGMLAPLRRPYTIMPGLWIGVAGLALTLSEHGESATRSAQYLFKHGIPHPTGVRFLGDFLLRYSADLWSGSAGILLALDQILDPRPNPLFTVDSLVAEPRP